jgi:hypothetical protein
VVRRDCHEFSKGPIEKWIGTDKQSIETIATKLSEHDVDILAAGCTEKLKLETKARRS